MKQVFYAIGILMFIISGQASAQTSETAFMTRSSIINSPFVGGKATGVAVARVSLNALERFKKDYKDAKDVEWAEVANGYRAYFMKDAVLTAVDYTKKGRLFSVIRFGRELLSGELKTKITGTFEGMEIKEVTEVKIADFASKAYVVLLDGKTSLKTIQIIDDDIMVLHEEDK
jgi:hypothetical protein